MSHCGHNIGEKYSDDSKVRLLPLEEFIKRHDYFVGISAKDLLKPTTKPEEFNSYYKFTSDKLICIDYYSQITNYGTNSKPSLGLIEVAYRDGKTEYESFNTRIKELEAEQAVHKRKKSIQNELEKLRKAKIFYRRHLPKYQKPNSDIVGAKMSFDKYLVDTGSKTDSAKYGKKYVVFDVETNGLRRAYDDLLSLTIYDPFTGMAYNRFFPLDQQPLVLTSYLNGITDEDLKDSVHMTQEELNWVIDFFDLKNSVLLSYSGGEGTFDSSFVDHYCERHKLYGFGNLQFENIKKHLPALPLGSAEMTKDKLCSLFGIEGVRKVHSGLNDCILEWKLFEQLVFHRVFFINEQLYRYHSEYILPVSYLNRCPELAESAGITIPAVVGVPKLIYEYVFPKKALKGICKFPTNITGITLEHLLNTLVGAEKQDNKVFLAENRKRLEYIGSIETEVNTIPIIANKDGTVKAVDKRNDKYINTVNAVTMQIKEYLSSTVAFIKDYIFNGDSIISQELVISEDRKVLAICDLSSSDAVVEIKTSDSLDELPGYGVCVKPLITRQLFFESNGRNTYLLQIRFQENSTGENISDLRIQIFNVKFEMVDNEENSAAILDTKDIVLLELLQWNPLFTYAALEELTGMRANKLSVRAKRLKDEGYLINQGTSRKAHSAVTEKYIKYRPSIDNTKPVYVYDWRKYDRHLCGATMIDEISSVSAAAIKLNLPENYISIACQCEKHLHAKYLFSFEKNKKRFR